MRRERTDTRLEQLTRLVEEVADDNTALVAELKRLDHSQREIGADLERAVAQLREELADGLAYRALKDLCRELVGPLAAIEAMLDGGDFSRPEVVTGHLRSLCLTLQGVLARMGAEKLLVVPGRDRYDPRWHQCVGVVHPEQSPYPHAAPDTIVRVVEDGYMLGHRPLLPVRVEVQAGRPALRDDT